MRTCISSVVRAHDSIHFYRNLNLSHSHSHTCSRSRLSTFSFSFIIIRCMCIQYDAFFCTAVGRFHFFDDIFVCFGVQEKSVRLSPIYCQCMQFSRIYQFIRILSFASYENVHTFSHEFLHPHNRKSWHITVCLPSSEDFKL